MPDLRPAVLDVDGTLEDDEKTVDAHSRRYEPLRDDVRRLPKAAELLTAMRDHGADRRPATRCGTSRPRSGQSCPASG